MLFEIVTFGSVPFWVLFAGFIIAEIACIEAEHGALASFVSITFVIFLAGFSDLNPFTYVTHHAGTLAVAASVYLVLGIAWGIAKWYFFVLDAADQYREARRRFLVINGVQGDDVPDSLKNKWRSSLPLTTYQPKVSDNKVRIITWMAYWPFSGAWTLINDPVRHFYRFVYERIARTLQSISNHVFQRFDADFQHLIDE